MEQSTHYGIDKYGHKYSNTIWNHDEDIVVFGCEPPLEFDIKAHGLKIRKRSYGDYDLIYELMDGVLYLHRLEFEPELLYNPGEIMGAQPSQPYPKERRYSYVFDSLPVDYSGVWSIGKDFDFRFWSGDEKANSTPFCPEVFKQNGFIRFEKGRIVEFEIHPRNN